MKQFTQTILHDPARGAKGDCWRTSLGCLLDLDPLAIPHFALNAGTWWEDTQAWLRERGKALYEYAYLNDFEIQGIRGCHHILSGPSPRNPDVRHSIIGLDGEPHWDPHPDRSMLAEPRSDWYLTLLINL